MAGTLYIVATPIGNLEDMPPRVAATFGAADFIAAEDTRVTMKLLNFLGLKKPMVITRGVCGELLSPPTQGDFLLAGGHFVPIHLWSDSSR